MDAWWPTGHIIGWEHTLVHENYEFLTAVAAAPYEPSIEDGLAVQQLVTAIERSDEEGTWETL